MGVWGCLGGCVCGVNVRGVVCGGGSGWICVGEGVGGSVWRCVCVGGVDVCGGVYMCVRVDAGGCVGVCRGVWVCGFVCRDVGVWGG